MDSNDLTPEDLNEMTQTYLGLRDVAAAFSSHYEPDQARVMSLILEIGQLDSTAAGTAAVLSLAVGVLESLLRGARAQAEDAAVDDIDRMLGDIWDDFHGEVN